MFSSFLLFFSFSLFMTHFFHSPSLLRTFFSSISQSIVDFQICLDLQTIAPINYCPAKNHYSLKSGHAKYDENLKGRKQRGRMSMEICFYYRHCGKKDNTYFLEYIQTSQASSISGISSLTLRATVFFFLKVLSRSMSLLTLYKIDTEDYEEKFNLNCK